MIQLNKNIPEHKHHHTQQIIFQYLCQNDLGHKDTVLHFEFLVDNNIHECSEKELNYLMQADKKHPRNTFRYTARSSNLTSFHNIQQRKELLQSCSILEDTNNQEYYKPKEKHSLLRNNYQQDKVSG